MASKIFSTAIIGLNAVPVEIEADISPGLPAFNIVGLPDATVKESRDRVRTALKNSGLPFPRTRLTVNLAPAHIRKEGPSYDLPIAIAILTALDALPHDMDFARLLFLGELALSGELRPIAGTLPTALMAQGAGFDTLYLPLANSAESTLVSQVQTYAVRSLPELVAHLRGENLLTASTHTPQKEMVTNEESIACFSHVKGQHKAKRALEIAAAGGHNVLLSGPPGSGKTMLTRAVATVLPRMSRDETLEVTKIYSVAGLTAGGKIVHERPFRSPHHSASSVALIGGGSWPSPGEVSLAHRGVLFLDEFPEFPRAVLENLRQPLEDGFVTISRASGTLRFPAEFMLIAAQNPCPCGHLGDPDTSCTCTYMQINGYKKKVSGPLLDRIDLHVQVPKTYFADLFSNEKCESSSVVRARVEQCRTIQEKRFENDNIRVNAEMRQTHLLRYGTLEKESEELLQEASEKLALSARACTRIIKLGRTIADLDKAEEIQVPHLAEALQFREQ